MPPRKIQDENGLYSIATEGGILRTSLTSEDADEVIRMLDYMVEREENFVPLGHQS